MSEAEVFKAALRDVVVGHTDSNESVFEQTKWGSEKWRALGSLVTQAVLDDAHEGISDKLYTLLGHGAYSSRLVPKAFGRVQEKKGEERNAFKVVNDWLALRIFCKAADIAATIQEIRASLAADVVFYVRGSSKEKPDGGHRDASGQVVETIEYAYAYSPEIGYVVEMQIGEPLAFICFEINSKRRIDPELASPFEEPFFFKKVHTYCLQLPGAPTTAELRELAEKLYGNKAVVWQIIAELEDADMVQKVRLDPVPEEIAAYPTTSAAAQD